MGDWLLDDFEQEQDQDDGEDEADASAAVVAEPWSHAIKMIRRISIIYSPCGEDSPYWGVMRILLQTQ